jgi:hypothetical protein
METILRVLKHRSSIRSKAILVIKSSFFTY